ncbi:MAG: HlyD family type I secretion periplasmic adaptor subunit, partial [Desulfobulbia bacterium]
LQMKRQRLIAQRARKEEFSVDQEIKNRHRDNKEILAYIAVQETLHTAVQNRMRNKKHQLLERIQSHESEITGLNTQISATQAKKLILTNELTQMESLQKKQLITKRRLNELHKEKIDTEAEFGRLISNVAKIQGQIAETNLQIIEIDENSQQETLEQLEQVESKIQELREKLIAAKHRLDHLDIRAPENAYVHELRYRSKGGVISAGETIMQLVPNTQDLSIEVKVRPIDIDQVRIDATATVSFPSLNQKTTPFIKGKVNFISPDQSLDERSGESYFTVRLFVAPDEMTKLEENNLSVGIPAEVMIETGSRTVLSYLVKPLTDQLERTFREN